MNKEQFFKAIDNVDDELLKGVFDDSAEELPDAEAQHGAVYRPERRPRRKTFIAAAACLTAVAGAGFAVKAGVDGLSARNTSYIESPANASGDTIESPDNNSVDTSGSSFNLHDYISEDGLRGDEWSLGMSCMVYVSFFEDDAPSPFSPTPLEISEPQTVTASLTSYFHPDPKMPQDNIPYRIFVFADGKPIEFAPEGTDDYALWHDYSMDEGDITDYNTSSTKLKDGTIIYNPKFEETIKIDFKADESTHIINFVYCFFPELCQPHSWLCFSGMYSAMAVNTAYVPNALPETKQLGEYITPEDYHNSQSTGCSPYLYQADDLRNAWIYKDLEYSEQSNTFYIEFNSGKKRDNILDGLEDSGSYYLFLLIDGELQPAFDGDYSCFVDCENGTRTFKYQIPPELLPASGKHTIQYMLLPAEECSYSCGEATPRIRISALSE